jgi:hypothetical protein
VGFSSNVRHFERFCGFLKKFLENGGFDYKFEAFINITRLFEDIFNGIEAFLK